MNGLPGALRQATGELEALGAPFTGERLALNPAVLPVSARREMAAACRAVLAGVDFLVHRYLDADLGRITDALQLSELETKLWDVCPEQDWALMARPDVVLHRGSPWLVDINAVSNAAFFSLNDQLLRAQHALPEVTSFLERCGARAPMTVEKIDLLPWIERHQNDLVLKAANGHGGAQVVIGREVDPAGWRDRMTEATAGTENWIVQQLIDPDRAEIVSWDGAGCVRRPAVPAVYGAFLLERRLIGAIRRSCGAASTSLNINGSHGAVPSPVHWQR